MSKIKITLDTNIFPIDIDEIQENNIDIAIVSATERELNRTSWEKDLKKLNKILEVGVFDESHWDRSVYKDEKLDKTEEILKIVSDNTFPKDRSELSDGHKRQLRDALILNAHFQNKRDVFVTNDVKGFIKDGKKDKLEIMLDTKILNKVDFLIYLKSIN